MGHGELTQLSQAGQPLGGGRTMGKVAAQYDEFFFNDPAVTGGTVRHKDFVSTPDGLAFLQQTDSAEPNTWYIAFSIGKNANGEWGPLAAVEFKTPGTTGINEVAGDKQVAGVRYYNIAGQEMTEANGLTIVVTTYTDGTTRTTKVMK